MNFLTSESKSSKFPSLQEIIPAFLANLIFLCVMRYSPDSISLVNKWQNMSLGFIQASAKHIIDV